MSMTLHPAARALIVLTVVAVAAAALAVWTIDTQPPPATIPPQLLPIEPTLPTFAPTPATPRAVELAHATTGPAPSRRPVVAPPAWAQVPAQQPMPSQAQNLPSSRMRQLVVCSVLVGAAARSRSQRGILEL